MAKQIAFFVQFPHPGGEHNPPINGMPWNTGDHRRKFLIVPGRYVDGDGLPGEAELVFWGEWEPPSRLEQRWSASGRLPRALHRPYWAEPSNVGFRQNTDPWVFGDTMIYSNCRQSTPGSHRPNSMQRLNRGSVICFGSTIEGEYCIDTVFVVASASPWVPAKATNLKVDDVFRTCTVDALMTGDQNQHRPLTLYHGATFDNRVEGMFSFVPVLRADADNPRFPRPSITLPGLIDPSIWRNAWGSRRQLPIDTVRNAWEKIREQVFRRDLCLGVAFRTPNREADAVAIPKSPRRRC